MFDDIVGWLLLSVVSALAVDDLHRGSLALSVVTVALVPAGAWLLLRPVRYLLARSGSALTPAVAALIVLLAGALTQAAHLEAVFGARRLALKRAAANGNRKASRALARLAPPYRDAKIWITTAGVEHGHRSWPARLVELGARDGPVLARIQPRRRLPIGPHRPVHAAGHLPGDHHLHPAAPGHHLSTSRSSSCTVTPTSTPCPTTPTTTSPPSRQRSRSSPLSPEAGK
jgi:hypothetical protein